MERKNSKLNEVNVRITDKEVVKNVKAYCRLNKLNYVDCRLRNKGISTILL